MGRLLFLLTFSTSALASVTQPFPGMTVVREPSSALVIADLCSAGISMRATKYSERNATPQQWAQNVGAQAAINADFFDFPGWTLVNGRARGSGEDWPANKQFFESRSYWQFGLFVADLVENANLAPAGVPWVTEVVGGHNVIIRDGISRGPSFDGDSVITTAHRRTAIGLSKDRRTVFLFATDKSVDGNGEVAEMVALQREAGGPPIDIATNMDGGGSSQLYVEGMGQIITSGRPVNNHLGIFARGSGPAANCNNLPPHGTFDQASCGGLQGWAQDGNVPGAPIDVHLYFGGPAGAAGVTGVPIRSDDSRADLCTPLGSCEHGFALPAPRSLLDGKPHPVHAYAIDSEGGPSVELASSPRTLTCAEPAPEGTLRHVVSGAALTAWRFSYFLDVQPVSAAKLGEYFQSADFPLAPRMVRATGQSAVYLVDRGTRRHVKDAATAARWRLDLTKVEPVTVAELDVLPLGPPLRPRPLLIQGPGPAVYLVDDALDGAVDSLPAVPLELPPLTLAPAESGAAPMDASGGCSAAPGSLIALAALGLLLRRQRLRTTSMP